MGGLEKEGIGGERKLPSDISHGGNVAFRCFHQSQPQNSQVLVSCLSFLTLFYVGLQVAGYVLWLMISSLLHFDVIHSHPLPSLCPPFLSVFVLSVNVLDGGLSPGKHHYSNFLCNMNDGDPLFISDLLITPQPIAYPPRQGSHSHSRHYFIKRARLQRAVMNNAVIMQVWCMQWLSSSSREESRMGFTVALK